MKDSFIAKSAMKESFIAFLGEAADLTLEGRVDVPRTPCKSERSLSKGTFQV
jgi:hypothetical protein